MFYKYFLLVLSDIDQSKILQVVSDSPNVNLHFLKNLAESREKKKLLPLFNIGRCGLHVIHISFETGAKIGSDWDLQKLLKAMWKFLQKAPTDKSLYENVSESLDYLLQLCRHRWCEKKRSAERAGMIIKSYRKFITYICSLKKSQQPDGKNKSFQYLESVIYDSLLPAKLKFFEMVSGKFNAFL